MQHKYSSHILIGFLLCLFITSCAVKKLQVSQDASGISSTTGTEYRSFFLLGNLNSKKSPSDNFKAIINDIKSRTTENDYTLILGDNVDSENFNRKDKDDKDKKAFQERLNLLKEIKNNLYVLPGNEDWNDEGLKGLKNIEEMVEDALDNNEAFQPENGCPLEDIEISDSMHLFIVDTQWYIEDWNKNPKFNDECEINTREKFITALSDEMRKQRHKTVIVAMHHPLYSNGVYGGQMSLRNVYKPSSENFYVPVVGSTWSFIRSQGGVSRQDRHNPLMNEMMEQIKAACSDIDRVFFVSAHENTLQFVDDGNIKQIVSGTAVNEGFSSLGKKGLLSSGQVGYAELRVFKDKSSQVIFYHAVDGKIEEVYAGNAFAKAEKFNTDSLPTITDKFKFSSVYSKEETKKDQEYEEFYGKHYRNLYGIDVKAPVVMLDTLYGGLKVERAGGGNQTQGLRLVDSLDREFNMRALEKDAIQFLKSAGYGTVDVEEYFGGTFPQELIRDFYTAAHPYGAFAVPRLAGAIDLNHTHPKLFYVPKQETLGDFNETHGDRLYMIVEKPDKSFDSRHMFGDNQDVESTPDMFEKIREDEKQRVDEQLYVRARIFDMLLGDWDRHEDQWRWAEIADPDDEDKLTFIAVPRDRDQVFARFDGKLLDLMRKYVKGARQFGVYGPDIPHIEQFSQSAIKLDRAVLQRSDLEVWQQEVAYIQNNLTPEIVEKAFNEMPDAVKDDLWKQTQQDLLARKENLPDIVNRYYKHFLEFQTLKGTDKDDHFIITRLPQGITKIEAYRIKDGEKGTELFSRTFDIKTTQEIWIYGLDDDDVFEVKGKGDHPIKIVLSGGKGDDQYLVENGKKISIYDYKSEENELDDKNGAKAIFRDDYDINHYDTEKVPTTGGKPTLDFQYNPDHGFTPTVGLMKTKIGYESNPYSSMYGFKAQYYSLTQAAKFDLYAGIGNAIGHWNLEFKGLITTNNYTENFFGYGNDTEFDNDTDYDVNRVQLQRQEAGFHLIKDGNYGSTFDLGIGYQGVVFDPEVLNNPGVIQNRDNYLNYHFNYSYNSVDNERFPTRGMAFQAHTSFTDDLSNGRNFFSIDPDVTFWNAINDERTIVLKTNLGIQTRLGDDPFFYQAAVLGAQRGLRSFRNERFAANYAMNASGDVVFDLKPMKTSFLPVRITPYVGYDIGKVWLDDRGSSRFHNSYGGGFQLGMTGLFTSNMSYFYGDEGGRLQFGLTFSK
ncbi:MAG: metallophosphoesterase [Nonlabens sp.]|uniref:metallophosphoesterase family protein n=1 Tax=Nonlabens sp. TaxID=1888209 RepID=UPI003EF1BA3F